MKRFSVLCFIILAPFLSYMACKKKAPAQPPVYLSYQFKSYFDYRQGSYWIYKDTLSATTTDSFVVYNYSDDTTSIGGISTETVTIGIHAYTVGTVILDSAEWDITLQQNTSTLRYNSLPVNSSGFHYVDYAPFTQGYPFLLGTASFSTPGCNGFTNYSINYLPYYTVDSNVVDSNTYSNVYQVHYQSTSASCAPSMLNDWIYIDIYAGIVKMKINNQYLQKVLELQRYHINR